MIGKILIMMIMKSDLSLKKLKVIPEVVRNLHGTDLKGVEYQKLTALLIEL